MARAARTDTGAFASGSGSGELPDGDPVSTSLGAMVEREVSRAGERGGGGEGAGTSTGGAAFRASNSDESELLRD